jgi:Tol biopolymer transport system component
MLALQMLDDAGDPEIYVAASDGSDLYKVAAGTSPSWGDHHRLAYVANNDVFVSDLDHATTTRIGPGTASRWSPRGDLIATPTALIRTDGTRVASLNNFYDAHWAPDGNKLITISDGKLEAVNLRGAVTRTYATVGPDARSPVWSPDGRWIAYIGHASTYRLVILDARTGKRAALWALDGSFDFTTPSWTPTNVYVAHT